MSKVVDLGKNLDEIWQSERDLMAYAFATEKEEWTRSLYLVYYKS